MYVFAYYVDAYDEEDEENEATEVIADMWQEACWIVISSYFDEKGEYDEYIVACKYPLRGHCKYETLNVDVVYLDLH